MHAGADVQRVLVVREIHLRAPARIGAFHGLFLDEVCDGIGTTPARVVQAAIDTDGALGDTNGTRLFPAACFGLKPDITPGVCLKADGASDAHTHTQGTSNRRTGHIEL